MRTLNRITRIISKLPLAYVLLFGLLVAHTARAATTVYAGTNGVSATTNWSDTANFINASGGAPTSPANNAANFSWDTAVASPGLVTVHADGGYGTPGSGTPQAWAMIFGQTNGYHTVLVDPGIQLEMRAASGTPGNGLYVGPASRFAGGGNPSALTLGFPYTNHTVIEGGGSFLVNGQLRVEGAADADRDHYSILDMSGLNTFTQTNSNAGSSRFLLVNGDQRSQGLIYLATNNFINIYSDMQIGWIGNTYSNSLPIGLYLGMSNVITTGPNNNGNELEVAMQGVTNAFIKFNPAFLGGATKPTVYLGGDGAASGNGGFPTVSGIMAGAIIGDADGASVPSYGDVDFTGGQVTWQLGQLDLGRAGVGSPDESATGMLTFDDGIITVNDVWCGWQQYDGSGANGASPGIGIINIGANATLQVNNALRLAVATGTPVAGTAGTINVNGGTLAANSITNGGGTATLNLTNATLELTVAPGNMAFANATVSGLNTGGTTNVIAVQFSAPPAGYPFTNRLVAYSGAIGGAGYNFGLQITNSLTAQLVDDSANHEIDLVVSSGPAPSRNLVWSGADSSGNWDVGTTANWLDNGLATTYHQLDFVRFDDTATGTTSVNLTTALTPGSLTISNNALPYTFGGSGYLSGAVGLDKEGSGALVMDNSGANDFSGGITIGGGTLQVGNNDTSGNLPVGPVVNNGALVFNRADSLTVNNAISGSGALVQAGAGGTLQLSGANSFAGPVLATNGSVLQLGSASALGIGTNAVTIASGSTLDTDGHTATRPVLVSGTGVGGNGAIIDSGGAIYDNPGPGLATNIMLTGDTTFTLNSPSRWDLGSAGGGSVLGATGAYNLTLNGNGGYFEWRNLSVQPPLANITIASGNLGVVGSTTFGDPNATLVLASGGALQFYGPNVFVNKQVDFQNGASIINSSGANVMSGAMTLETGAYCTVNVGGGTTLSLSNVLTGSGVFYQTGGTGTAILWGNSPSFTGGVLLYNGQLVLNGLIGSGITSVSGTTVSGTGTANGLVDVSGTLQPGAAGAAGTFTAGGGLTLEGSATLNMDLNQATGIGGGTNDLIAVTGDLTVNGNNITINPLSGALASGTYTLITYTGNLVGSFGTASTVASSRYNLVVDTSTPHEVRLIVTGQPNLLVWNNDSGSGEWDVQSSLNWSNLTTHAEDQFFTSDSVLFDDSIVNSPHPTTTVDVGSGIVVIPSVITNNSAANYTISGAGKISGGASFVKLGTGTLTLGTINDFTGDFTIGGGAVQMNGTIQASASPVGAVNGTLFITNGATLKVNLEGSYPPGNIGFGAKPIVVSGAGAGGNGAIQNIGNSIYNDSSTLAGLGQNVTLTGDTTIGGTARWDWGYPGLDATLSTHGSNFNFTAIEPGYSQWSDLMIDTNLGNFDFYSTGSSPQQWRVSGMGGSLGNPTNVLTLHSNVLMHIVHGDTAAGDSGYAKVIHVMPTAEFRYQPSGGAGDYRLATSFVLDDNSSLSFYSGNGGSGSGTVVSGTVTLNGLAHLQIGDSTVTFSNVISGPGGFYWDNYNNTVALAATNTYQGITDIRSGRTLALIGNGSISGSTNISLASGAVLDVSGRTDQTLTLATGQTLQGNGTINGNLAVGAGAALSPGGIGVLGILSATNAATLSGSTLMDLNQSAQTNDVLRAASITYGGTLSLTNLAGTFAAGNSFKLFSAASYDGAFSGIVTQPPLAAGLAWNTNNLTVDGTISVVAAAGHAPRITRISLNGTTLTLTATNGSASGSYVLWQSTNVALPLSQWTAVLTNSYDSSGNLNLSTNIVDPNHPREFYILSQ